MARSLSERLVAVAESLEKKAAEKRNPAIAGQNLTARRASIAAGMARDGEALEKRARIARRLADLHDAGEVRPLLSKVLSDAAIKLVLMWDHFPTGNGWVAEHGPKLRKLGLHSNWDVMSANEELEALGEGKREPTREEKVRELERGLLGVPIPGFFPTPEALGRRLIELAGVESGDNVIEPSAGKGDLVELILEAGAECYAVEVSHTLGEILAARFEDASVPFRLERRDWLEVAPELAPNADAVVMNPPFEKGADMRHVLAAWHCLRDGGRLAAIVSEGPFFREDAASQRFRLWLDEVGADVEKVEPGAFTGAGAFRQTGVACRIVAARKR